MLTSTLNTSAVGVPYHTISPVASPRCHSVSGRSGTFTTPLYLTSCSAAARLLLGPWGLASGHPVAGQQRRQQAGGMNLYDKIGRVCCDDDNHSGCQHCAMGPDAAQILTAANMVALAASIISSYRVRTRVVEEATLFSSWGCILVSECCTYLRRKVFKYKILKQHKKIINLNIT